MPEDGSPLCKSSHQFFIRAQGYPFHDRRCELAAALRWCRGTMHTVLRRPAGRRPAVNLAAAAEEEGGPDLNGSHRQKTYQTDQHHRLQHPRQHSPFDPIPRIL